MIKEEIELTINKQEVIKDLQEIKDTVKDVIGTTECMMSKLRLKRKDVLVVKINGMLRDKDKIDIAKKLKKILHRKVIVVDQYVESMSILER